MDERKAIIVADLGFGDAGKGTIVDYISRVRHVAAVVRFNGGAQAAHNVTTPEGTHHTFSQFGSETFVPGVRTHLSRYMLVDPVAALAEAQHLMELGLGNPFDRFSVEETALVVTPFHKLANRLRETLRDAGRHGSCGMGIGETMADSIAFPHLSVLVRDLRDPATLLKKLRALQELKYREFKPYLDGLAQHQFLRDELKLLTDPSGPDMWALALADIARHFQIVSERYLAVLAGMGDLVFEGAQGVLIDEWHGFHPYTTWSTTTFANALQLLKGIGYDNTIEKLGVLRAYYTRHGAGPFPTEDTGLTIALPDRNNGTGRWQGAFRVGWFDAVLAHYALAVSGGADTLAITNLDRFANSTHRRICTGYDVPRDTIQHTNRRAVDCKVSGSPDFFHVTKLNPKPVLTDLTYQSALTEILEAATPVYRDAPADDNQYLCAIERMLNVPVTITSYGRTALEKQTRSVQDHAVCA
ncbi:MAG: adenylosuccinate synthetase [Patescibacteria group bacterium]